jgi:hypothetical protein
VCIPPQASLEELRGQLASAQEAAAQAAARAAEAAAAAEEEAARLQSDLDAARKASGRGAGEGGGFLACAAVPLEARGCHVGLWGPALMGCGGELRCVHLAGCRCLHHQVAARFLLRRVTGDPGALAVPQTLASVLFRM